MCGWLDWREEGRRVGKHWVIPILGLDKEDEEVGIVIAFGYPDEDEREKIRITSNEAFVYHF